MYEPWRIELEQLNLKLQEKEKENKKLMEENDMLKKQKIFLQEKCREIKRN